MYFLVGSWPGCGGGGKRRGGSEGGGGGYWIVSLENEKK